METEAKGKERTKRDSTEEEVSLKTQEPQTSDNGHGAVAKKPSPASAKTKKPEIKK